MSAIQQLMNTVETMGAFCCEGVRVGAVGPYFSISQELRHSNDKKEELKTAFNALVEKHPDAFKDLTGDDLYHLFTREIGI